MKILKGILNKLNMQIPDEPPETGGILGSKNDDIITDIINDRIKPSNKSCHYEPNVNFLNWHINKWTDEGITFKGVFHTHFVGIKTLSYADKVYISVIMKNMPKEITYLYFPVFVLPERELVCYKAEKSKEGLKISCEDVIVI